VGWSPFQVPHPHLIPLHVCVAEPCSFVSTLQPAEDKKPKYVVRPPNALKSKFLETQESQAGAQAAEEAAKVGQGVCCHCCCSPLLVTLRLHAHVLYYVACSGHVPDAFFERKAFERTCGALDSHVCLHVHARVHCIPLTAHWHTAPAQSSKLRGDSAAAPSGCQGHRTVSASNAQHNSAQLSSTQGSSSVSASAAAPPPPPHTIVGIAACRTQCGGCAVLGATLCRKGGAERLASINCKHACGGPAQRTPRPSCAHHCHKNANTNRPGTKLHTRGAGRATAQHLQAGNAMPERTVRPDATTGRTRGNCAI